MANFDVDSLPISGESRNQLKQIHRSVSKGGKALESRTKLFRLLLSGMYYQEDGHGTYIPLTDTVKLWGKKPTWWDVPPTIAPQFFNSRKPTYFTNGLSIFGAPDCPSGEDLKPINRVANTGLLVVTMESDPSSLEGLEEQLAWVRGKEGKLEKSCMAAVDGALCQFKEYVGCCIVYSGNKSLHCHFVFNTQHLEPSPEPNGPRWNKAAVMNHSAYMVNVHARYWDVVCEIFCAQLKPSVNPDPTLRCVTHWRRFPFGQREDSAALQLVLWENIRKRAPRGAAKYLVPRDFISEPAQHRATQKPKAPSNLPIDPNVIGLMQKDCSIEWGQEYPKPHHIEPRDNGFWILFLNRADDQRPSTFVGGEVRKLQIYGQSDFNRDFFLPHEMSANEFAEYCMRRCGHLNCEMDQPESSNAGLALTGPLSGFAAVWAREGSLDCIFNPEIKFKQLADPTTMKVKGRESLKAVVNHRRRFLPEFDQLVCAPEGIGKTQVLSDLLPEESFDRAVDTWGDGKQRFACVACRSYEQAAKKAEEFKERAGPNTHVQVIRSFTREYQDACRSAKEKPLEPAVEDKNFDARLRRIKREQPNVYKILEDQRARLWANAPFDGARTIIFTSHALAHHWHNSLNTRAWIHPDFVPSQSNYKSLAPQTLLSTVIHDEVELDEILYAHPASLVEIIMRAQSKYRNWGKRSEYDRRIKYAQERTQLEALRPEFKLYCNDFDKFDELMRLDFDSFDRQKVDRTISYGFDMTENGIYTEKHGTEYYIAPQPWIAEPYTRWIFLTTESLPACAISEIYKRIGKRLIDVSLPSIPGMHPCSVPVFFDNRANTRQVDGLARELQERGRIVIADGSDYAYNFQKAKGRNDLSSDNIAVILKMLAPELYAKLNVIGGWLGIADVLQLYQQDQLNQAVGRNRGYRDEGDTTTEVYATSRFWKAELQQLPFDRTRLYRA